MQLDQQHKPALADLVQHAHAPYNAAKAHEYYLRTRKLHPRKKGSSQLTSLGGVHGGLTDPKKQHAKLQAQRKTAAARVKSLQSKLTELNRSLKKAMAEARKANKPETAADKHKAARDAKKYRSTHKQELKTKAKRASAKSGSKATTEKTPAEKVDSIKSAIKGVETALTAAKARQRALG